MGAAAHAAQGCFVRPSPRWSQTQSGSSSLHLGTGLRVQHLHDAGGNESGVGPFDQLTAVVNLLAQGRALPPCWQALAWWLS